MAGILLLCGASAPAQESPQPKGPQPVIERPLHQIRFKAQLQLKAFLAGTPPGHHLITWKGGRAGKHALLRTEVSDTAILNALQNLGAKPGDNLVEESWTERADPTHSAPDLHAEGSRLAIILVLKGPKGERYLPLQDLLVDVDKRGFDWRLAGNRALIARWRSGCVVCLQSCPGSKIANASATMRHLHTQRSRFKLSELATKLGEGAKVEVLIKVLPKPKPGATPPR